MEYITRDWKKRLSNISSYDINSKFIKGIIDNKTYKKYFKSLTDNIDLNNIKNIVEFGPGYGELAKKILSEYNLSYNIIDLKKMLKFSENHLNNFDNVKFYDIKNIDNIHIENIDLLIATNCFSEIPMPLLKYIKNSYINNSENIFIVDPIMIEEHIKNFNYIKSKNYKNRNIYTYVGKRK